MTSKEDFMTNKESVEKKNRFSAEDLMLTQSSVILIIKTLVSSSQINRNITDSLIHFVNCADSHLTVYRYRHIHILLA